MDSLPALFKPVFGLQVRVPPPPYPLAIVSCSRANASLFAKVAPSPLPTMATFVFRIQAPETSEQVAYHTLILPVWITALE